MIMEKNLTCVSTTPEEMYLELQAEKEQIHQNASAQTLPKEEYAWLEKNDKYIIYKNDCNPPRNQDVCIILEKKFAKRAMVAGLLPTNKGLSPAKAGEIVLTMVDRAFSRLYYMNEEKIKDLPTFPKIVLAKAKNRAFSHEELLKVFELPNAQEIILEQVKKWITLRNETQLKIFELQNPQEIIFEQVKNWDGLCHEAQLKAFDLPNAQEIIFKQAKNWYGLCHEAQLKAFELPNAQKIIRAQAKRWHGLCDEAEEKARKLGWL